MFKAMICLVVLAVGAGSSVGASAAHAADTAPKIAATDLTYEEKVSQYFRVVSASSKSRIEARASERETDFGYAARSRMQGSSEDSYQSAEGTYTYIERGELHTYTADLKGALLQDGRLRLTQARPYAGKAHERVFDIIARIRAGGYPGADYVLFGTVSNIAFRQEAMPLAFGASTTDSLSLDLVVDFSLLNTRTFEVRAAFSANGSGQDTKIVTHAGDQVVFNRAKVMQETSRSLAANAYGQLMQQLRLETAPGVAESQSGREIDTTRGDAPALHGASTEPRNGPVFIYK